MSVIQEIDAAESLPEVHVINMTLVDWFRDIATYDSLTTDCDKICRRQTELMEKIRKSRILQKTAGRLAGRSEISFKSSPTQPSKRAFGKIRARKPLLWRNGLALANVQAELHLLDAKLAASRARMRKLAARMLTFEPKTQVEAAALIRLVSRVLGTSDKFDRDYIADVLDTCAEAMIRVFRPIEQSVH